MNQLPERRKTVLIVDDDRFHRQVITNILRSSGFSTLTAENGERALAQFERSRVDLVVLDVVMPGLDGFQTCRELRRLPGGALLPVLMMTGKNDPDAIRQAFEAEATDFLCKPIVPDLLINRVRYLLRANETLQCLALAEARLSHAQRIARLGSWRVNVRKQIVELSPEARDLLGITAEESDLKLNEFLRHLPKEERPSFLQELNRTVRFRRPFEYEHHLLPLSGPPLLVLSRAEFHHPPPSDGAQIIGTIQDITRMRNQEETLNMLREAVEALSVGLTITDTSGRILYVNPAEARMHGYTVSDLIARKSSELGSRLHRRPLQPSAFTRMGSWRRESVNLRKNEDEFPVFLSSVAVRNAGGAPIGMVTICEDLTERRNAEKKIHFLANYDPVTGLPNRIMFRERLNQAMAQAVRQQGSLAVLFLELDNFKTLTETRGHEVGDRLLGLAAARLRKILRESDVLARLGGDKFVVLFTSGAGQKGAADAAKKIIQAFSAPFFMDVSTIFLPLNVGISLFPSDSRGSDELLRCADIALHEAKSKSGSTFCFFSRRINRQVQHRIRLEENLRRALEHDEISLYFQPQLDLKRARLSGFEVLARWRCPELGSIPPSRFIPVAEDTGLITDLGRKVILGACRKIGEWHADHSVIPKVGVNVSVKQLFQDDFLNTVETVLRETGTDPAHLCFEITESMIIDGNSKIRETIKAIRSLGIELVIDDFGTGHSSLIRLKEFPFDKVKIDRTFITDLEKSVEDVQIVRAIILMAQSLGKKVVAEGIETKKQYEILTDLNCDEGQGFYIEKILRRQRSPSMPQAPVSHA